MLQLVDIRKSYTTGDFTQVALDDVSLAFRDNEFVAILGPSGSGKTTLLNIIGGLDHYDSGDLIIDGVSTKNYKDRDWDTFRNNRIGFVFQSYNLIPHQTVLANVELALTLSGVGREERRQRAIEALEKVGLGDHINKKPNQLSGGQMQRVAIARALINDPEILLADEPTGALDSKTSVQIMDLLTEIANDRLVIMVTHNPELADAYATRIVNLADGVVLGDTDPYTPTPEELARVSGKRIRRTSMSFLTALSLSFNNLMTKKGRTIMTAFAGSIGIIGIAAILALANGVNAYIASVEEETLSSYPLKINSTGFDMTAMMVSSADVMQGANGEGEGDGAAQGETDVEETVVGEANIMNRMLDSVGSNDLESLKEYLDSGNSDIDKYVNDIQYIYNVVPQIFLADTSDGVQQINPDSTFSALGMGSGMTSSALMSSMMSTNVFEELSGTIDMVKQSYDLKAGHWPEQPNECLLVLTESGQTSDFLLYVLGLRDREKMEEMVRAFMNEEEIVTEVDDDSTFTYRDFLNAKMKLVCAADFYKYDKDHDVWVDKQTDEKYMKKLVDNAEDIVISGIIQPNSDKSMMSTGIYYTSDLVHHLIEKAGETQVVKDQLAKPNVDVFSGKKFGEKDGEGSEFDMSTMFSVDQDAISAAFKFDSSKLSLDMDSLDIDFNSKSLPEPPKFDANEMFGLKGGAASGADAANAAAAAGAGTGSIDPSAMPKIDEQKAGAMVSELVTAFASSGIGLPTQENIQKFLGTPAAQAIMGKYMASGLIDFSGMQQAMQTQMQEAMQKQMTTTVEPYLKKYMKEYMTKVVKALTKQMGSAMKVAMNKAMNSLSAGMADAMHFDAEAFKNAFQFDMSEDDLKELVMSMIGKKDATFDGNLAALDYAELNKPYEIDIFPKNFEDKQNVIDILDAYNDRMNSSGQEDKAITYTDIVGALMKSVTTIVDMISYVLIAFVSISLIVSSIMIGVITYISVLERKKEIGILRAIGASKSNISQVFNAETVIEGLIAGLLGVGVTALGCIPASAIVYALFDVPNVAQLPLNAGITLVAISVVLTFIAGLIPASSASRKDPVEALRSE